MAELSWPSPDNGRAVTERQYELLSAQITEDGLLSDEDGTDLEPDALAPVYGDGSGMNVKVRQDLFGQVRGFGWTSGTSAITKTIAANATGLTRIDRIVLELSRSTWNVRTAVVQGTAGGGIPALTRSLGDSGLFQVPLARVTVPTGDASITNDQVFVDAFHIGSRIRPWASLAEMQYPKLGEVGFDVATGRWFGWNGTSKIYLSFPQVSKASTSLEDAGTTNNATQFVETLTGAASISLNFTAGPQGKAMVRYGAFMRSSVEFADVLFGARIRKISDNSIVRDPFDSECAMADGLTNAKTFGEYHTATLTPGEAYKLVGVHRCGESGMVATYNFRTLSVDPY